MQALCVFSGSRLGGDPAYQAAAIALADAMLGRSIRLVYGGGNIGLMGVMADRMLAAGGEVEGVIPRCLVEREVVHNGLTELHIVETMHERKALMADAFIAIPGGFGTLEELFEVVTWRQLRIHNKPCGLLNVQGYFDDLLRFLDHCVAADFVRPGELSRLLVDDDAPRLLDRLEEAASTQPALPVQTPDVR